MSQACERWPERGEVRMRDLNAAQSSGLFVNVVYTLSRLPAAVFFPLCPDCLVNCKRTSRIERQVDEVSTIVKFAFLSPHFYSLCFLKYFSFFFCYFCSHRDWIVYPKIYICRYLTLGKKKSIYIFLLKLWSFVIQKLQWLLELWVKKQKQKTIK